ncbi:MAG: hypothetical protein JW993_21270 [Sedimentisphaerales bacterium]|nr:hypothetical protein [Sedimentisphaerales bacterium]
MAAARDSRILRGIGILFAVGLFSFPAQAKYSGGAGTPEDPYQIATAGDLIRLGESTEDYDKHFVLAADIDLNPNLPGPKVFDKALIAASFGTSQQATFTGVFDGNGHTISHLTIRGGRYLGLFGELTGGEVKNLGLLDISVIGSGSYVGGLAGRNSYGDVTNCCCKGKVGAANLGSVPHFTGGLVGYNLGRLSACYSRGAVSGDEYVGGLVGINKGAVTQCYSTCAVAGSVAAGGLAGSNEGTISDCYARGSVTGSRWVGKTGALEESAYVGGLVGADYGGVIRCYSTAVVSGDATVGGLVGYGGAWAAVTDCFWDIQTSGQAVSAAGEGKATGQMQTAGTYRDAGWDFVGDTENGTEDIWWIREGRDYPRLAWEFWASSPDPPVGAAGVMPPLVLSWRAGEAATGHEVYLGKDEDTVARATPQDLGIYRGQQEAKMTTYNPGLLRYGTTYYWRIDEVNEADPNSPWKGNVWSFTTADLIVVDDFESCDDENNVIYAVWADGYDIPENGSVIGCLWPIGPCVDIAHTGRQSMQFNYENTGLAHYSEAVRTWPTPQNWTVHGMDTLTLYVHGWAAGDADRLYVALEDSDAHITVVAHPDSNAVLVEEWIEWSIPLSDFTGVNPAAITRMVIGIGDRDRPAFGSEGLIHIDDIRVTKAAALPQPVVVLDDFEDYNDLPGYEIWSTWITPFDLPINGAIVGHDVPPYAEQTIVHGGTQSMPFYYDNTNGIVNSRAQRTFYSPQDLAVGGGAVLSLWFRGAASNGLDVFYLKVFDSGGRSKTVFHPDPNAVVVEAWTPWFISPSDLTAAGANIERIATLEIGVGDQSRPSQNARGILYIDDIGLVRGMQ